MKYILIALCNLVITGLCQANSDSRPNVLFLAVDDMNDWIGCLETTPRAITPNIDRLAARGVNFSNAHTAGVFCAPSRAAIFSGQFASTTGCYQTAHYFVNRPEIESLQSSFARAGYTTLGAGKLFHHPTGAIDQRDWTEFFLRNQSQRESGWPLDSWNSEEIPFPDPFPSSIYNRGEKVTGGLFLEWGAIPDDREEEMADTIRINWAVEQLEKKHDKPFFLACGIYAPHFPNYCPQKYFDLYDPEKIPLPPYKEDDLDDLPPNIRKIKTNRSRIHHKLESLDAVDDAIHGYLACMSYADAMMGRVLDALEAGPYADNTIVVFWSDHGYHHGEKGDWGKHTLWERTSNVPFIWAGPGVAEGAVSDVTVSLIDMYPTFVEMCGLPQPAQDLEGRSIAATLKDPSTAADRNVFLPHMNPGEYAVINRDWRYIKYRIGEELYDLKSDPNEWHNLAGSSEHDAVKSVMQKSAPANFAEPEIKLNSRKDLVIEGETFRWEKGKGNYVPEKTYLPPYTATANERRAGDNLIVDGSFESLAGETGSPWKIAEGVFQVSTSRKVDGTASLQWKGKPEGGTPARQVVKIQPGHSYRLSFQLFVEPGSKGRIVIDTLDRFDDTAQTVVDAAKNPGKWQSFSVIFTNTDYDEVTIRCFPGKDFVGGFFIDDVKLIDLSMP
jgi:arylsulfatase A-like enzyme